MQRKCKHCEKLIPKEKDYRNKFCDSSCAAKHNLPLRKKAPRPECLHCGKLVGKNATKYCSIRCQHDYSWAQKVASYKNSGVLLSKTNKLAKRFLKQTVGIRCVLCGDTEHRWNGAMVPIPLILDHIDGNSDNWQLTNLRLVCGRCDMLLPTYKSKNRGNGRHYRRIRYANGQSY